MSLNISDRDRRALILLAGAFLLYLVTAEVALPAWDRLSESAETAAVRVGELERYRRALARHGRYAELEVLAEDRSRRIEGLLIGPDAESAPEQLRIRVEALATEVGIVTGVQNVTAPRVLDDYFVDTAIAVSFDCTPGQLVSLLSLIRQSEPVLTVRRMTVQAAPQDGAIDTKQWRVTMTIAAIATNL